MGTRPSSPRQLSLLEDEAKRARMERMEYTIDGIRRRFGHNAISQALLRFDKKLGRINAKADHTIHPIGFM